MSDQIAANAGKIREKIRATCEYSGRSFESVKLLAVSKGQPADKMNSYLALCREKKWPAYFGENYIQDFRNKRAGLKGEYEAHFIGVLQSNKAKEAVSLFDVIESVHSEKIAAELEKYASRLRKIQNIFIQINVSNDNAKSGFQENEALEFISGIEKFPSLRLAGLMTITREYSNPEDARPDYAALRMFRDRVRETLKISGHLALSMGMSHDYYIAVQEGADIVRIGTALFGKREER